MVLDVAAVFSSCSSLESSVFSSCRVGMARIGYFASMPGDLETVFDVVLTETPEKAAFNLLRGQARESLSFEHAGISHNLPVSCVFLNQ